MECNEFIRYPFPSPMTSTCDILLYLEVVKLIRTRNRCWRSRIAILDQRRQCLGVWTNGLFLPVWWTNRE
jgi:hypothetical protein